MRDVVLTADLVLVVGMSLLTWNYIAAHFQFQLFIIF